MYIEKIMGFVIFSEFSIYMRYLNINFSTYFFSSWIEAWMLMI